MNSNSRREEIQSRHQQVQSELNRLKQILDAGHNLNVNWVPDKGNNLEGEVRGDTIWIHSQSLEQALNTLRHEFLDYSISQLINPYRQVTNSLIDLINKEAYARKEKLVTGLAKLLTLGRATVER
jgi:hypothetical protein